MAQILATCSYLKDVICLRSNQAGTDRGNAIIAQGLDDRANLIKLAEYGGVKTLCQNFRKPAGNKLHPGLNAPNPSPRKLTALRVARSGQDIPTIRKQWLNMAAYGARIFSSIGI